MNAGSNDISGFAVNGDQLELINRVSSGGVMLSSIAMHSDLVYVLNAGAPRSDCPRWMLLRTLFPGVFARQSEGERACFRRAE